MKKFILTIPALLLTSTLTFAAAKHFETFAYGKYECPEHKEICTIHKLKNGEIIFSKECMEDIDSTMSKYAPMIKREQCKFTPDNGTYVSCIYADAECVVTKTEIKTSVKCNNNKNIEISDSDRNRINYRVLNDAAEGKCKPLYDDKK